MAYQPHQRELIEKILTQLYGYKPEALPNLHTLRMGDVGPYVGEYRGSVPLTTLNPAEVPPSIRSTIRSLVGWRQAFPETIDSIIGLASESQLPSREWSNWMTKSSLQPYSVGLSGNPSDLARQEEYHARLRAAGERIPPNYYMERPTLYEQALAEEPAGPQFSQSRFVGRLPDPSFSEGFGHLGGPADYLTEEELANLHPKVLRRLMAMQRAGSGQTPHWGDLLAADTLRHRLQVEAPDVHRQLLDIVDPSVINRGTSIEDAVERSRIATKRIAQIYSQQPYRHSGEYINRDLELEPNEPGASAQGIGRYLETPVADEFSTPGQSIYERLKRAEFRPNKTMADNLFDELDTMQKSGFHEGTLERMMRTTAATARNPTNSRIQSLLNEAIGFGKGQMAGAATPELLLKGAGGIAAGMLAPKLIDLIAPGDSAWNQALKGAATGAGWGSILGPEGALAGAGVGALASQIL